MIRNLYQLYIRNSSVGKSIHQRRSLVSLLLVLLFLAACQDPTSLGTDLLGEDQAQVDFTDTLTVRAATVRGDSVLTFIPTSIDQLDSYLFGDFNDPVFGRSVSSIYTQLRLERIKPDFDGATLDSIVLVLPYDTAGLYGRVQGETFGIEVFRLTESMSPTEVYYSEQTFQTEPTALASQEFTFTLDSISVIEYVSASSQDSIAFPHLRIPLPPALGEELLALDTTATRSSADFQQIFKGLYLRPTLPSSGLLSFGLNRPPFRGGIYLYYEDEGEVKRQFQFEIDEFSVRTPNYQHEYEGSVAGAALGDFAAGDTTLYVQGMAGLLTEIQLPDPAIFAEGIIVNKAELIVELKMPPSDTLFPPAQQLILTTIEAGERRPIVDISLVNNRQSVGLERGFGGSLNQETGQYVMNISTHFQEVLKGIRSRSVFLNVFTGNESAARSVLKGAEDGIKIRLSFTKL